ncbi:cupin domain-containing protein [Jiella endophytica]|uniref:Cupin domain-containing protein n=1 Tax=Jiella endophytica TaxID=2558362 RepID=A0A4Y8R8C8_9HYPH|nr:cupin domain-containing protein [Jiella endophytica]TFF17777.1 cupin domain-containing protein [Jiella endophytica]
MNAIKAVVDPTTLELDEWQKGSLYGGRDASFGELLGLADLGIRYCEVPPGKSACPFHNHHVEDELYVLLEGEGEYRFGTTRQGAKAGDVLAAPAGGPETAHQLINTGAGPLRYLVVSSMANTEICEYPDSGKFLVETKRHRTDASGFRVMHRPTPSLPYWEDEPGAEESGGTG